MEIELTKRRAAMILYEMMVARGEEDTPEVAVAGRLKDLYDCHRCVRAISQVYAKGIVPASVEDERVFGNDLLVSEEEMEVWKERVFRPELRKPPKQNSEGQIRILSWEAAKREIRESGEGPLLIDLRDEQGGGLAETKAALEIADCGQVLKITLQQLRLNPFGISDDREQMMLLLADSGGEGVLAADMLARFGFTNLIVICLREGEEQN